MFTGIVEEVGIVKSFTNKTDLEIECSYILDDIKIGDSIAVNGVCETVTEFSKNNFKVKVSSETLNVTTFKSLKQGDLVNLERALTLNSRLGGHIVSGHVDCIAKLIKIDKLAQFYNMIFEIPQENLKYLVYKGSITINGISLTIAKLDKNFVTVAIIPHTFNNTCLKALKIGENVNIETDILGKYVEKMLLANDNKENHITMEFLAENGFV